MRWLRGVLTSPPALIGGLLTLLWLIVGAFAPLLSPLDPLASYVPIQPPGAPSPDGTATFWLGTDLIGRDILSRLIWGTRTVLVWASISTAAAFAVGIAMGLVAGYYRGRIDAALSFVANAVLSFPVLVLYVVIIISLGASGANIVLAVTFASAPAIFRLVRALTIDLRSRDYVQAAITQGEGDLRIMLVEILPNAMRPVMVDLCLRLGYTAATIGVLGFLGLGLPPPTPDWGGMVSEGRGMATVFPHLVLFPALAISSFVLGLSLLADGLEEISKRQHGRAA